MKIYKATWNSKEGRCVAWVSSQAEGKRVLAYARRKATLDRTAIDHELIVAVEVKPTKAGILELLRRTTGTEVEA